MISVCCVVMTLFSMLIYFLTHTPIYIITQFRYMLLFLQNCTAAVQHFHVPLLTVSLLPICNVFLCTFHHILSHSVSMSKLSCCPSTLHKQTTVLQSPPHLQFPFFLVSLSFPYLSLYTFFCTFSSCFIYFLFCYVLVLSTLSKINFKLW